MSAKLFSPKAELAVLRGMCHKQKKIAGTLLGSVDESYFDSNEGLEIYRTVRKIMAETGESPTYRLLIEDPALSRECRTYLRDSEATIQSIETAKSAVKILNRYRQMRGMFKIAQNIDEKMNAGGRVDLDELMEESSRALAATRSTKVTKEAFLHFGVNNNSKEFVHDLIFGDHSEDVIPSCIPPFDEASGGMLRGGLVTIGASSGGGKSLLANHMASNIPLRGFKVLLVPLEMTKQEMTSRIIANRSRIDVTKILTGKLATGEKELAYRKYEQWVRKVRKAGGRLTVFKPEEDMSFDEVIAATNAYDCDVRIFDYISLFKGADGDDSWQALGAIARAGKIHAGATNSVNVLLCQVNDDGKVRYARAISEHSNNSFIWVAKAEEREKEVGHIRIQQPKARNSKSFPFDVGFNWSQMRLVPLTEVSPDVGDVSEPTKNLADVE